MPDRERGAVGVPAGAAWFARHAVELLGRFPPPPGSVILDVGSGAGDAALAVARAFRADVVGVDAEAALVHEARRRARGERRVTFFVEEAAALPFHRDAFDVVLSLHATHRLPDWERALAEMERVLKPGGRLVFSDFVLPEWLASRGRDLACRTPGPTWQEFRRFLGALPLRAEQVARSPLHWEGVLVKAA